MMTARASQESTVRKKMATGTFTYNALHAKNFKRAYGITKKNCKSLKLDKSNAAGIGTTAVKPYIFICPMGLVWFGIGIVVKCKTAIFFLMVD